MTTYLVLKLLHLLAMVYWLGGDLGTYLASRQVVNPDLTPAQRATALKIMLACDQGPKLSMPLIFALGLSMSAHMQWIQVSAVAEAAVWVVALAWFANVNFLYFTGNAAAKARLSRIDLWFRVAVVLGLAGLGIAALMGYGPVKAEWLAAKIMIFAGLVACGIWIRLQLKPFVPAFGKLMSQGSSPEIESVLSGAIARCRPAVYVIWLGLVASAALGLHLVTF